MSKKNTTTASPTQPVATTASGPTAPCASRPKKRGKGLIFGLIGVPVLIIILAIASPSGCQSKTNTPKTILGPLKVEEITVKLDSLKQQVIVPTNGRKVTIKWVNPKVEGDSLVDWRTHGPYGMDGGNILSGGWVKPPREHPEISDDKRVFFWSFILEEGGPVELIVKIHYRDLIVVQPTP